MACAVFVLGCDELDDAVSHVSESEAFRLEGLTKLGSMTMAQSFLQVKEG